MRTFLLFTAALVLFINRHANAQCSVSVAPTAAYGGTATYNIAPGGNLGPFQVCNGATVYDTMLSTQRRWYLHPGSVLNLKNTYNHVVYMRGNSTLYNLGGPGTITIYKEGLSVVYGVQFTNSCTAVSFPTITCPTPTLTGIDEYLTENEVSVYPNPAENQLTVENKTNSSMLISINNVVGCETRRSSIPPGKTEIDLSGLSNGFYFVRFSGEGKKPLDRKIIVSH